MMDHSEIDRGDREDAHMSCTVIGWLWGLLIKGECWGMRRVFFPFKK